MTVDRYNDDLDVSRGLLGAREVESHEMAALHARVVAEAESAGLLDIAYRTLETSIGLLLLAATPLGLVRVAFPGEKKEAVLEELALKVSPRILQAPQRLDETAGQIEEYLSGRRRHFDLPVDLSLSSGFRRKVLEHLPCIEYGETSSYQTVARGVENPKAVRAVGSACASNPIPLVIPCHRVVRSDGLIGAYRGGSELKRQLLAMEAEP